MRSDLSFAARFRSCTHRFFSGFILCAFLMIALAAPALASGSQLVFSGTPLALWTELDLIQQGRTPPTNTYPMTLHEFHSTVLREELPPVNEVNNTFVFSLTPYYCAFNTPYGGVPHNTSDVIYLYDSLPPVIELGSDFTIGDWFNARLVMDESPGLRHMSGQDSFPFWEFRTVNNMEFPKEGYLSLAIPNASFTMGRFNSGIGFGYFGNTFLNGKAPHYDQFQFTYYNRGFKFFYMLGSTSAHLSEKEALVQASKEWDTLNDHDACIFDAPVKMFAYHRVEFRPFDWLTFGIGEMNIIGGKAPEFIHINPFGFWHNTYTNGFSNLMMMLDVSMVPFKGMHIFGEFTIDDVLSWDEDPVLGRPNSFAWQLGARYVLPFWTETKHVLGAEFTHVDPWTYNRAQPYLTMYQRLVMQGGWTFIDIPLGFAFGGDLNHYGVYYSAVNKDGLLLKASYHHLDKGPIYLGLRPDGTPYFVDYNQYNDGPFREGAIVESRDTIELSLAYPLPWNLTLHLSGYYSWIDNFRHVEDQKAQLSMFLIGLKWHL